MRADARSNHERILAAARALFASDGADTQVDAIARRAGVGVGTVYRHFPDKDALMGALVRERFIAFNEQLREAISKGEQQPFAALCEALRANSTALAEDAGTRFAFMRGGERVFAHAHDEVEEYLALTNVLVDRAKRAGSVRPDFDVADVPMLMCGVCATIDAGKGGAGWDWRRHLELVLAGMAAAVAEPSVTSGGTP